MELPKTAVRVAVRTPTWSGRRGTRLKRVPVATIAKYKSSLSPHPK